MTPSSTCRHWIRPLKDGRVEWFMSANGHTCKGSGSHEVHRMLWDRFEAWSDIGQLPAPEVKPMRGRA